MYDELNKAADDCGESVAEIIRNSCKLFADISKEQLISYNIAKNNKFGDCQRLIFHGDEQNIYLYINKKAASDLLGMGKKAENAVSNFLYEAIKENFLSKCYQPWPYKDVNLVMIRVSTLRIWCLLSQYQLTILGIFE